jgi:hypothetical protein
MLAPSPNRTLAHLTSKELQEEADGLLAQYHERPEDLVFHHRLDANGLPIFPIVARHVDLVGAHLWNGVKPEKNSPRPWGEWHWSDTVRTYEPERLPDPVIEPPAPAPLKWTTPKLIEIFKPPLIEQHAGRRGKDPKPPEPARCLTWNTPTIVQVGAEDLLDLMFVRKPFGTSMILASTLPTRAFSYLAARRRAVPGLVPNGATPVEAALTVALWARANASPLRGWTPACIARDHALRRPGSPAGRPRLHMNLGDEASADWGLLLMTTLGGLSAREAAKHVGLGRDVVAKRLRTLPAEIEASLGILSLNGQNEKFAQRVGRRKRADRTDHPQLMTGDRPAPLQASPDDTWLVDEAIEYFGATKLPPGCAGDIIEKDRYRGLDTVKRGDPDDDESPIVGKADALRTAGWYSRLPRATDWRAIARGCRLVPIVMRR